MLVPVFCGRLHVLNKLRSTDLSLSGRSRMLVQVGSSQDPYRLGDRREGGNWLRLVEPMVFERFPETFLRRQVLQF